VLLVEQDLFNLLEHFCFLAGFIRDAIRTMGGKAFSTQDKKSTITRGWGPMLTPGGASGLETKESSASPGTYMQDMPNPALVPPNITSEQEELRSESPLF
jgi:hypothetical protein